VGEPEILLLGGGGEGADDPSREGLIILEPGFIMLDGVPWRVLHGVGVLLLLLQVLPLLPQLGVWEISPGCAAAGTGVDPSSAQRAAIACHAESSWKPKIALSCGTSWISSSILTGFRSRS